jgi:transcriptional regulator with XRE-family HTH domain
MNNITEKLRYWRKKRNISKPDTKVFVENVLEELLEIYYDDKALIKSIQEHISKTYFNKKPIGEINTIDAIQDIQVFGANETELMGYDNILCNREVFKHIDCRVQDPIQAEEWKEKGAFGKWKKYELQDESTLYEPQYEECKL